MLLENLDLRYPDERVRWNRFFESLSPEHPLASHFPDESLVRFTSQYGLYSGNALDLGCGTGRNSLYLAKLGHQVDAIDLSETALEKAQAFAEKEKVTISFMRSSVFDLCFGKSTFDLIHDSGLLHHIFPHRRRQYIDILRNVLKPRAFFSLVCFNEKMGTQALDCEIEKTGNIAGGISFNREKLCSLLGESFECLEYYDLQNRAKSDTFGYEFLAGSLWRRR